MFDTCLRARIACNIIDETSKIDGFDELNQQDKDLLTQFITHIKNNKIVPTNDIEPAVRNKKADKPAKIRTSRLIPSSQPTMKVMFTNADQLSPDKQVELVHYIKNEKPLLIAVTEIKPKHAKERDILDYTIQGYTINHVNLDSSDGRGVAIFVHNSIQKSVVQIQPTVKFEEVCLLEIKLRHGDIMIFGCVYRSPTLSETSSDNNVKLNSLLRSIAHKKYSHVCILGDFNYRDINWNAYTTTHNNESNEAKFLETIQDCFLYQHITKETRKRGNDVASLLDLVLTNESMQVSEIAHHAPLGKSDHAVISFNFYCYLDYSKPKERFNYAKADFHGMRRELIQSNWANNNLRECATMSVEDNWIVIKDKLQELTNKFVPKSSTASKPTWSKKGSIPIEPSLREMIRKKNISHRRWMSSKSNENRDEYNKVRNKVKRLMRQAKRDHEKGICLKSKSNPKAFWSHVRHKLRTKIGVAPLLENSKNPDSAKFEDKDKADILQKQFSSVFTREDTENIPLLEKRSKTVIGNIIVTKEIIENLIGQLNIHKSCGPDNIHPRLLIELRDHISAPLAQLMNKTFKTKAIPQDWKKANVSPIFKKGARNKAENYRPISLTSIVCKLMESIIKEFVMKHLFKNGLLSKKQYGFISGRSTVTQLLKYLDDCAETMANGGVTDTIYLDFAKAFDTVPHERLLVKLKSYGIEGEILHWIEAFLSERTQVVQVNGEKSFVAKVLSGIPQGSVLGPLLFVIYINDLPENLQSQTLMFADDTKVFRQIVSENDSKLLQDDIDNLVAWTEKWLLSFNTDKCHVLTLGKVENITHTHQYKISDHVLEHVFDEKDLGVTFDSDLNFETHIASKVNKANSIAGLIRRTFSFLDGPHFKRLYVSFVRPHLEYAQSVWAPHLKRHIDMLENVQIRATKLIDGFSQLTYTERLKILNLPTLAYRRARGDMIEVYKHIYAYDKETMSGRFIPKRGNRQHNQQLIWYKAKDGTRGVQSNSFYFRTVKIWNDLPNHVIESPTINAFKNRLDRAWIDRRFIFDTHA